MCCCAVHAPTQRGTLGSCRADGSTLGYVRPQTFGQGTADGMNHALRALEAAGADGYILDMRGNSGGIVNAGDCSFLYVPQRALKWFL
jgi:carboxyl-terminal processing protease